METCLEVKHIETHTMCAQQLTYPSTNLTPNNRYIKSGMRNVYL